MNKLRVVIHTKRVMDICPDVDCISVYCVCVEISMYCN
jgi:hypothetical protein